MGIIIMHFFFEPNLGSIFRKFQKIVLVVVLAW